MCVVEAALPDAKAKTAIGVFAERIVNNFGVSFQVIADQGSAFTSLTWVKMITFLLACLNIKHFLAAADHQQSNGFVERPMVHWSITSLRL